MKSNILLSFAFCMFSMNMHAITFINNVDMKTNLTEQSSAGNGSWNFKNALFVDIGQINMRDKKLYSIDLTNKNTPVTVTVSAVNFKAIPSHPDEIKSKNIIWSKTLPGHSFIQINQNYDSNKLDPKNPNYSYTLQYKDKDSDQWQDIQ